MPRSLRSVLLLLALTALLSTACRKPPPISLSHRPSVVDQGIVLIVTNTSDDYLHDVKVSIESPAAEQKSFSTHTLQPHQSINVGWLKLGGWPIPEGSKVTVACKGYSAPAGPWTVPLE